MGDDLGIISLGRYVLRVIGSTYRYAYEVIGDVDIKALISNSISVRVRAWKLRLPQEEMRNSLGLVHLNSLGRELIPSFIIIYYLCVWAC